VLEEVAVRRFVAHASEAQLEALGARWGIWSVIPSPRRWCGPAPGSSSSCCVAAQAAAKWLAAEVARSGGVGDVPGDGRAEIAEELGNLYRALAARGADAAIAACDRHRAHATAAGLRASHSVAEHRALLAAVKALHGPQACCV
jgi:hypothetical protein